MSGEPKISIIIIHYNTPDYLKTCFDGIMGQTYRNFEVIFIDNNSPDDSGLNFVRENFGTNEKVKIVANKENLGYSGAANQGIRMAIEGKTAQTAMKGTAALSQENVGFPPPSDFEKASYVVITNPDIIYTPDYFKKAVARMEKDEKIAALTGKIYRYDFKNNKTTDVIDTVGLLAYKNRRIVDDGQGLIDEGQFNKEGEVFGVSGACPLYRVAALEDVKIQSEKIPGEYLDNDFFMYKEDVDLSWRFQWYGWKCFYYPEITAYHGRGTGVVRRFSAMEMIRNRKLLSKFQKQFSFRNDLLMFNKNETWGTFFRDFFSIMMRIIATPIFITFMEPYLWKSYFQFLKLLPKILRKRKIIMQNKRISAKEMSNKFSAKSKYLTSARAEN